MKSEPGSTDAPELTGPATTGRPWIARSCLLLVAAVFLAWHVPLMYATAPGLDEDWFGVTGITILRSGVPRIPYLPSRDPASFCYKADVALFSLPPLSFYLQAAAHLVLGDGIGPARMASTLEGLAAACVCYGLAFRWSGDRRGAVLAATAYVASRAFLFPATTARPDMAATLFGLLAIDQGDRARLDDRARFATFAGIAAGLALLAHPFAAVPATQVGLRFLTRRRPIRRRLRDASIFSSVALAVFSLWGLLIVRDPDLFRIQFGNNVLNRAGPGLGSTLRAPLPVLAFQAGQALERIQPIQAGLYLTGLAWAVVRARRQGWGREFLWHLAASLVLLVLFEGRHPTMGYYAYPAAFASIGIGTAASDLARRLGRPSPARRVVASVLIPLGLLACFLPGAGIRALESHFKHRKDPAYDARGLARAMMADLPRESLVAVDGSFVMEFYLAGRPVVEASANLGTYDFRTSAFEYVVLGRVWKEPGSPTIEDVEFLRSYGDRDDIFSPYAEVYRRSAGGRP